MTFDDIINNIEKITSELAEPAVWSEQTSERRFALVKCALYDAAAYACSINKNFNPAEEICQRAAAEQAIHIAKQIFVEKNGLVISEENINGLGSRRYKLPDPSTLAERCKMYIATLPQKELTVRTVR